MSPNYVVVEEKKLGKYEVLPETKKNIIMIEPLG